VTGLAIPGERVCEVDRAEDRIRGWDSAVDARGRSEEGCMILGGRWDVSGFEGTRDESRGSS